MNIISLLHELRMANLFPMFVDDKLGIAKESLEKAPVKLMAKMTKHRVEIKTFLKQQEEAGLKPYLDEEYSLGKDDKGCLVVPSRCKNRYKYWLPKNIFIIIESEDWFQRYKRRDDTLEFQWKPINLVQILNELGAPKEFIKRYAHDYSSSRPPGK